MAVPLCRLAKSIWAKKDTSYSRLVVLFYSKNRCLSTGSSNVHRQKKVQSDIEKRSILTYAALVASGIGYGLYKWRNELSNSINVLDSIVPTIYADKKFRTADVSHNRETYNFIADVVEISAPSVVYIEIKDQKRIDFFTGKPATTSNGSGFIVKEDGLILTNAHVVINKPNTLVKVRLHDGSTHTGIVEDVDMHSDLATVRINKTNLPVMKLGSSSSLRPGEFVVAIGSPLSLSNTITSGVVSSVNRPSEELGLHNKNMGYIQTDAGITFGNSGGPLVNLSGEAIGISAMKVTAGISFAIPIDYAKEFLTKSELRRNNKGMENALDSNKRRYLGVTMLTLTPDILHELQQRDTRIPSTVTHGVLIWKVLMGSPALAGGLKAGDIVTHVNGEPVLSVTTVYGILEKPGSFNCTVQRHDEVLQMSIKPEEV